MGERAEGGGKGEGRGRGIGYARNQSFALEAF